MLVVFMYYVVTKVTLGTALSAPMLLTLGRTEINSISWSVRFLLYAIRIIQIFHADLAVLLVLETSKTMQSMRIFVGFGDL